VTPVGRIVFCDNDVVLKLAEYNLLQDVCSVLAVGISEVIVLDSAKYYFNGLKRKLARGKDVAYSSTGLDRAIEIAENTVQMTSRVDIDWATECDNIDIGEAQLVSSAIAAGGDSILLTGDKRFIKAVLKTESTKHIASLLRGRIVCLEEIMRSLICNYGIDHIRKAVASAPRCDLGLQIVFGSRFDLPETQVLDGLASMINEINTAAECDWLMRL